MLLKELNKSKTFIMIKILKEKHSTNQVIKKLFQFLEDNNLTIHKPINPLQGLVIQHKDLFVAFLQESDLSDTLPPCIDGKFVICEDETGNLKEY